MPRLPRLRGREVLTALRHAGFVVLRVKGSHHFLQHPSGPGLLNKILKDAAVDLKEFESWL